MNKRDKGLALDTKTHKFRHPKKNEFIEFVEFSSILGVIAYPIIISKKVKRCKT